MNKLTHNHLKLAAALASLLTWNSLLLGQNDSGRSVVVIFNKKMPGSQSVAKHYSERRGVPTEQIFGYDLPQAEEMTRKQFMEQLQVPLLKDLEDRGLFKFRDAGKEGSGTERALQDATFRYIALCYGVPIKIAEDSHLSEMESGTLPPELRRSECSVDSQLACLPLSLKPTFTWTGPLENPLYRTTNSNQLHPTNGVLLVGRLDGPTADIARNLVDLAMTAETNGLWGRAYIDSRGLTNGPLVLGDEWMRGAFRISRIDFPTEFDNQEATFSKGYAMSQVAIYAGWYSQNLTGPFTLPEVDFMPGAFAYHLHSFTARSLRTENGWWAGPLLAKGATATIANVYEPFLAYTVDLPQFLTSWLGRGFTFAEAAWSGMRVLSWQTIMLGDPLYAPTKQKPQELHYELEKRRPELVPWSHLRIVTRNLSLGTPPAELVRYIETKTPFRDSAILLETLGDLNWLSQSYSDSLSYYEEALQREMTDPHRLRLLLKTANQRSYFGPANKAIEIYRLILKEFPNYAGRLDIYQKLLPMARDEGLEELAKECEEAIQRLAQP